MCHNEPFVLLSGKLKANYVSPPVALNSILHGWNTADGTQEGEERKKQNKTEQQQQQNQKINTKQITN